MRLIKKFLPILILLLIIWQIFTNVKLQQMLANLTNGAIFKKYYTPKEPVNGSATKINTNETKL